MKRAVNPKVRQSITVFLTIVHSCFLLPAASASAMVGRSSTLKEFVRVEGNIINGRAMPVNTPYRDRARS